MADPRIEKLPPQDVGSEEAVLGSILIDPDAIMRVQHILAPEDFYREKHGWIYSAMLALHERREPIDMLTLCDELGDQLDAVGGAAFITGLINTVPTSVNVDHYARLVIRCANNRRLIGVAGKIAQLAYENGDDVEAYSQVHKILRDTPLSGKMIKAAGGKDLINEMLYDLAQAQMEKERRIAADYEPSWPWAPMQRMARWRIGQPVVLIAEGGSGKTAFCTGVGVHNAINGGRIFYVATEDEPSVLRQRILSFMSGVPHRQIETAEYKDDDTSSPMMYGVKVKVPNKVLQSIRTIESWRGEIYFLPGTGRTIPEIVYDLSRLEMEKGPPDAIILDWFLDHKQRPGADNFVIGLMADILDLKIFTAEHRTRLLVATQTGKTKSGQRLTSFDAYYTSAWNHYAKLAVTLKRNRELVNGEAIGDFKPEIEVCISKANLDQTGTFKLMMRGETLHIFEPDVKELGYAYD